MNLWSFWMEMEKYVTKYHTNDLLHLIFYFFCAVTVVGYALNIETYHASDSHVDFFRSSHCRSAQAAMMCANRALLIGIYIYNQKFMIEEPFSKQLIVQLAAYGLNFIIFLVVGAANFDGSTVLGLFFACFFVEKTLYAISLLCFNEDRESYHNEGQLEHMTERHGIFMMVRFVLKL